MLIAARQSIRNDSFTWLELPMFTQFLLVSLCGSSGIRPSSNTLLAVMAKIAICTPMVFI